MRLTRALLGLLGIALATVAVWALATATGLTDLVGVMDLPAPAALLTDGFALLEDYSLGIGVAAVLVVLFLLAAMLRLLTPPQPPGPSTIEVHEPVGSTTIKLGPVAKAARQDLQSARDIEAAKVDLSRLVTDGEVTMHVTANDDSSLQDLMDHIARTGDNLTTVLDEASTLAAQISWTGHRSSRVQ